MAGAELELQGTPATLGDIANWGVGETTNPPAIGLPNPGTGGASGSAVYGSESELAIEKQAILTTTPFPDAELHGHINSVTVTGSPSVEASIDWSLVPYFGGLSVERTAPPVLNKTLGSILETYIGLVYDTPLTVQSVRIPLPGFDSTLYSFPGWRGNVWAQICDLLTKVRAEIVYQPTALGQPMIEVRPLSSITIDLDDKQPPVMRYEQGSPGHQIDVTYQNQRVISSMLADIANYSQNPSLESNSTGWSVASPGITPLAGYGASLASDGNIVVAVGTSGIKSSSDGITWTTRTAPIAAYATVTYGGGLFVALASSGTVAATSPDGITWTSRTVPSADYVAITWGAGRFVGISTADQISITSNDGASWASHSLVHPGSLVAIAYGNGVFCAVGTGAISRSSDGESWTVAVEGAIIQHRAITFGNGRFVAVGSQLGQAFTRYSTDGTVFSPFATKSSISKFSGVVYGNGIFAVAGGPGNPGAGGGMGWLASDGSTWNFTDGSSYWEPIAITRGPYFFVAVLSSGGVLISPDGKASWTIGINPAYLSADRPNDPANSFAGVHSYRHKIDVPSGGVFPQPEERVYSEVRAPTVAEPLGGQYVSLGVWVKKASAPGPVAGGAVFVFRNSSGGVLGVQYGARAILATGDPLWSAWSGVAPAGTESVETIVALGLIVSSTSGQGSATRVHVDAHYVIGANGYTYFDGDYPGASWSGTPNNSISLTPNPDNIPLYDAFADDNNIMSVESGTTSTYIITSGVYPTSIQQPVPVDTLPIIVGNYHVIDSTGLPIIADQWRDYGGEVNVAVGDGVGEIVVTIIAPDSDIPSTTGPYRLAASDGDNEYATFMVAGTGVITDPRTLNLLTGADRDRVTQELAATINSPFVNTIQDAYTVGTWLSSYSNGYYPVVDFTIPISKLGGIGLGPGSTFIYRDCKYRVTSVNWNASSCSGTAIRYSTIADYENAIGNRTIGDHDALWGAYTVRDFEIKPHKTV